MSITCRKCGTEIADKALICYRCGTATTEAKFKPADIRSSRSRNRLMMISAGVVALLALLVLLVYFLINSAP